MVVLVERTSGVRPSNFWSGPGGAQRPPYRRAEGRIVVGFATSDFGVSQLTEECSRLREILPSVPAPSHRPTPPSSLRASAARCSWGATAPVP